LHIKLKTKMAQDALNMNRQAHPDTLSVRLVDGEDAIQQFVGNDLIFSLPALR
jgi:hypothetical protein